MSIITNPIKQIKCMRMSGQLPASDSNSLLREGNLRRPAQFDISGIYQQRRCKKGQRTVKITEYAFVITHTEPQNTRRTKFGEAVRSWQACTDETKNYYKTIVKGKRMSGYNLYIRYYMNDLI